MAVIERSAIVIESKNRQWRPSESSAMVADVLHAHGWVVDFPSGSEPSAPDLVASKGPHRYLVSVKRIGEGRADRVLAALSQAILVAQHHAQRSRIHPMAVIRVDHAAPSLVRKLEAFHRQYAPEVAVGLVANTGTRMFRGPGLDDLVEELPETKRSEIVPKPRKSSDLFTDLNQWMLKVILAPELPEHLLRAPRGQYQTVSALAAAADVSVMSASRFAERLREEGFLESYRGRFCLVRRAELFRLWQSASLRASSELHMRFLIPGAVDRQLRRVATHLDGCVGLFAAADLLNVGHVNGVVPHLYVRRLERLAMEEQLDVVPARPGEQAQIILKQPLASESVFRGALDVGGMHVADVIQIWLDASAHPSRGQEQADYLARGVLRDVLEPRQ